jgi:catechol 2,3-dioxygenase-like lactoylglutathione lyase family enzyme
MALRIGVGADATSVISEAPRGTDGYLSGNDRGGSGMPITGLNHAVLYVADLERSVRFYTDVLGFRVIPMTPESFRGAAFLQAAGSINDHDLGLFEVGSGAGPSGAGRSTVGMYHLAWEVDTLAELERLAGVLADAGALTGASDHGTTKSLYGADPDGLEFEIAWIIPAELLDDSALDARTRIGRLDLAKEKERYGAETQGGIRSPTAP